jgi:hypothetical protein
MFSRVFFVEITAKYSGRNVRCLIMMVDIGKFVTDKCFESLNAVMKLRVP